MASLALAVESLLAKRPTTFLNLKQESEFNWWRNGAANILQWHMGQAESLWGYPFPDPLGTSPDLRAAVTAFRKARSNLYPDNLRLSKTRTYGRVLDLGCGPLCLATFLPADLVVGIDPLILEYSRLGYPLASYGAVCLNARAEDLASLLPDASFDTVLSYNALDHMDDFALAAEAVCRLAAPGATVRLSCTYRRATVTEPLELTDEDVRAAFAARPLEKIHEEAREQYAVALWGSDHWRSG